MTNQISTNSFSYLPSNVHQTIDNFLDPSSQIALPNLNKFCQARFSKYKDISRSGVPKPSGLPDHLGIVVHDFLDSPSRRALLSVNRSCNALFYNISKNDRYLSRTAKFIESNYEVIGGRPSKTDIRRNLFSYPCVVALGETHTQPQHNFLNSFLVNRLFRKQDQLFVEGGKKSLMLAKELALQESPTGMLRYVRPDICEAAKTWDLDLLNIDAYSLEKYVVFIAVAQKIFAFYGHSEPINFNTFNSFLNSVFSQKLIDVMWANDDLLTFDGNSIKGERLKKYLEEVFSKNNQQAIELSKVLTLIILIISIPEKDPLREAYDDLRDRCLQSIVEKILLDKKGWGFFLSGAYHTRQLRDFFNKNVVGNLEMNYLCLIPRNDITQESIQKSAQRIFHLKPKKEPVVKNSIEADPLLEPESQAVDFHSLDLDSRIEQLLALKEIDFQENHYSLWNARVIAILVEAYLRALDNVNYYQQQQLP